MQIQTIGQRAKAARDRAALSVAALHRRIVLECGRRRQPPSEGWIRRLEAGTARPDPEKIAILAKALGVTGGHLLFGEQP